MPVQTWASADVVVGVATDAKDVLEIQPSLPLARHRESLQDPLAPTRCEPES